MKIEKIYAEVYECARINGEGFVSEVVVVDEMHHTCTEQTCSRRHMRATFPKAKSSTDGSKLEYRGLSDSTNCN